MSLRFAGRSGRSRRCRKALGHHEIDGLSAHRGDGIGRRRDPCGAVPGVGQRRLELRSELRAAGAQIRIEVGGIGLGSGWWSGAEYTASVAAVGSERL